MAETLTKWDPDIELSDSIKLDDLEIAFHRTIRVPDNSCTNGLPPSVGQFPLFKVSDYATKLPAQMAQKGGLFFPMFQREAMWISFFSRNEYAIKIYSGNVNAISGEPVIETADTSLRRRNLLQTGKTIQDHVAVPKQDWLDGFAIEPGKVRQFVAMPMRTGYSVESQVTGDDTVGGLQFEITRLDRLPSATDDRQSRGPKFTIFLHGLIPSFYCSVYETTTVDTLLHVVQKRYNEDGHARITDMGRIRLMFEREILGGNHYALVRLLARTASNREAPSKSTSCTGEGGGMPSYPEPEMNLAAGGLIKQSIVELHQRAYQKTNTVAFSVQILNSVSFQQVTGQPPPPSPVSAETYADNGLPFFSVFEEPTNVTGDFSSVQSICQLNGDVEPPIYFPLIDTKTGLPLASNTVKFLNPNGAKREFKFAWEIAEELEQEQNTSQSYVVKTAFYL
ncbi:hypothetical protein ACHAPT_012356 [Fusarium lateritium]